MIAVAATTTSAIADDAPNVDDAVVAAPRNLRGAGLANIINNEINNALSTGDWDGWNISPPDEEDPDEYEKDTWDANDVITDDKYRMLSTDTVRVSYYNDGAYTTEWVKMWIRDSDGNNLAYNKLDRDLTTAYGYNVNSWDPS